MPPLSFIPEKEQARSWRRRTARRSRQWSRRGGLGRPPRRRWRPRSRWPAPPDPSRTCRGRRWGRGLQRSERCAIEVGEPVGNSYLEVIVLWKCLCSIIRQNIYTWWSIEDLVGTNPPWNRKGFQIFPRRDFASVVTRQQMRKEWILLRHLDIITHLIDICGSRINLHV